MVKVVLVLGHSDKNVLIKRLNTGLQKYLEIRGKNYRDNELFGIKNYIMLVPGNIENISQRNEMYEIVNKIIEDKYIIWNYNTGSTFEIIKTSFDYLNKVFPSYETVDIECIICTSSYHLKRTIVISNLLNEHKYKLDYIHTKENISKEENISELMGINMFLNYHIIHNLKIN